jgi:hypothetical protein
MIELALAIDLTISKDNYYPEETLQAEITGNFITLSQENIAIYEEGIPRPNPVISDLTKQDNIYYFYAILPNKEGNFSIAIENAEYISSGELKKDRIIKNFTIKKSNQTYLSINPGFVLASKDFSIKIKSPYLNQRISATLEATNQSKSINLIESDEKTLDFSILGISHNRTNIKIGNYNIPIFIIKNIILPGNEALIFSPQELIATVIPGENYFFQISIENFGDKNISNIRLINSMNAIVNPDTIDLLKRGERKIINLTIPVSSNIINNLSGEISAEYGNKSNKLEVFFTITQNNTDINLNGTTITQDLSCTGRGKICVYPENCSKEKTASLEGPCCLGDCSIPKPPADYGWVFGLILLIILGLIAYFLIKRARKKQKIKTSDEILDEKSKKFEIRMNPSKEVSGKLDRV